MKYLNLDGTTPQTCNEHLLYLVHWKEYTHQELANKPPSPLIQHFLHQAQQPLHLAENHPELVLIFPL